MKKIFIMAYARKNLGDDIFIKMLLERYSDVNFYIKIPDYDFVKNLDEEYKNLNVIIGKDTDIELYHTNVEEYDGYVYIGGSIFMEGGKVYNLSEKFYDFVKRCKNKNIPFCYISSNYGPYKTQEYFDLSRKNFETCTDICFRDKYSYHLFQDIKNVRYAPDFIFNLNMPNLQKIENSVGISIIDLEIRENLKDKNENYYEFLKNNISNYIENGKTIYLYSFCKYEGDEKVVDKLLNEFKDTKQVIRVKYDGNINKFLELYTKMEYMICARFHSMILSLIANQKIYVLSYSKKIDNVIEDLNLNLPLLHFTEIKENIKLKLDEFKTIDIKKLQFIIDESDNQEKVLKKILNKC